MKVIRIITVVIIILFISLSGKAMIPVPDEIDDLEILKLVGLDYDKNEDINKRSSLSLVMEKEESSSGSMLEMKKEYEIVMNCKASSFNDASRKMQFYTDKTITGSHVKYLLIGEYTAKYNIEKVLDELSKDREIRLSSHIFLIKNMNAEEFLKEISGMEYKLPDMLNSIENKNYEKTIITYLTISELLSNKLSESGIYLIPAIEADDYSNSVTEVKSENQEKAIGLKKRFKVFGYGIMKDNKLVDYLDEEEAIVYNMLSNKSDGGNIDIEDDEGNIISFDISDISCSYNFKFDDKDKLKSIQVKLEFRSDFKESQTDENITITKNIKKYEKLQEQKIKKQVEELIKKSQELNMDIFSISKKLELKHPYKFRKIKSAWEEEYKNLNIKVTVNSSIDRTYDAIRINK